MNNEFEQLVLVLSRSLIQSPPWEAFLREMESFFDCQNCVLFLRAPTEDDAGLLISQERTISSPSELVETYHLSPFLDLPEGEVCSLEDVRGDREMRKQFDKYVEFHRRKATTDILAVNLIDEETGTHFYFRLVRYSHPKTFGESDKVKLHQLLPHLKVASSIYGRIVNQQRQIYISDKTTTGLGFGFMVLRSDSRIVRLNKDNQIMMLNSAAARLIKERRGIAIEQGKLVCIDAGANAKLSASIKALLKPGHKEDIYHIDIPCFGEGNNLALMLRTFDAPVEFQDDGGTMISIVIRDANEKTALSADTLSRIFELTPAEAHLAERLVLGDSLAEAAESLGRSKSTVRAQLGAIFSKTGVHKQHQLISHIMHTVGAYWP